MEDFKAKELFAPKPLCYINLPLPPKELLDSVPVDPEDYDPYIVANKGRFCRSKKNADELNQWCKKNISRGLEWDLQIIKEDLGIHVDTGTKLKLFLLIKSGGPKVETRFLQPGLGLEALENQNLSIHPKNQSCEFITHKYVIKTGMWHLLKVDLPHHVVNLEDNQCRISLVANLA